MEKYQNPALSPLERAVDLTDRMTVEEQCGQLIYDAPAIERLGIPAYNWWNEGLHGLARAGVATMFPQAIALAAMFDAEGMKAVADVISTETRAKYNEISKHEDRDIYKGLTLWSPNINIFRDPRWGRGQETYGEDPYLTAMLGKAFVEGLQGDGKVMKTAACAKHYAVHSGPEAIRHSFDAVASKKDMEETYLPAFRVLVEDAKVEAVMGAYNRVNGEGACASTVLMDRLKEWGFDGHFVSDFNALEDFDINHKLTKNQVETAAAAIKSGLDLNAGRVYEKLMQALEKGLVTKEDIRNACIHVMRTRIRLGMFDAETEYDKIPYSVVACEEHKAFSLKCAERSMVLLKNNGILPLDLSKYQTIGVIGPNANSREALEGNYCGTADRYVTFLEGVQDAFSGRVLYSQGCHLYKDRTSGLARANDRIAEAETVAEQSDLVILCVGLDAYIEGEEGDAGNEFSSGDKIDLRLPAPQRLLLSKVLAKGKPTIIVTAAGSAINVEADCDALVHAWYPGQYGGKALMNLLLGNTDFSGKLPVTFYETADKLPDFCDYSMANRTYRNISDNVLYPFGFGLSYAKTACSNLKVDGMNVTVDITNTDSRDTEDVVQLYIKDDAACAVKNYSLCGFRRVALAANETKQVSLTLPKSAFESVDDDGVRAVRGKQFTLFAGTQQPDAISEQLLGSKCLTTQIIL